MPKPKPTTTVRFTAEANAVLTTQAADRLLKAHAFLADLVRLECLGDGDAIAAKVAMACIDSEIARAYGKPTEDTLMNAAEHAEALARWSDDS